MPKIESNETTDCYTSTRWINGLRRGQYYGREEYEGHTAAKTGMRNASADANDSGDGGWVIDGWMGTRLGWSNNTNNNNTSTHTPQVRSVSLSRVVRYYYKLARSCRCRRILR